MGNVVQDAHGSVCQASVLRGSEQLTEKQLLVAVL
jgi:hypothetical protein